MSDVEDNDVERRTYGSNFMTGLDVTPDKDGGVLKTILRSGVGDAGPLTGDTVYMHYMGNFDDGSPFDSSRNGDEKFQYVVGSGVMGTGWDIGIRTMKRNEVAVFYCSPNYGFGKTGKPPKIPPDATLLFEMELFSWRGEDVSLKQDGGVLKSRLTEGSGNPPKDGAVCDVYLIGKHNGRVFMERDAKFTLGEGCEVSIPDGVEEGLKSMKSGEKAILKLKSRYGYDTEGHERYGVPPDAELEFEVNLKSYFPFKEGWMMDDEERIGEAVRMKVKGTKCFNEGKYKFAAKHYSRIVEFLIEEDFHGEEAEKRHFLLLVAHLNMALCYLKLGNNLEASHACDEAIKLDSRSEKAYYRRAVANMNMSNYEEAVADFKVVLDINPKNSDAEEKIAVAMEKLEETEKKAKSIYKQMFKARPTSTGKGPAASS